MAIYLKLDKKPRYLRDLLDALYYHPSDRYICLSTRETYRDPECTQVQCGPNRSRSYDDLFELFQTYFPKVTTKRATRALLTYTRIIKFRGYSQGKPCFRYFKVNPRLSYCTTIRRIKVNYEGVYKLEQVRILCYSWIKMDSRWGWDELLRELKITDPSTKYEHGVYSSALHTYIKENQIKVPAPEDGAEIANA